MKKAKLSVVRYGSEWGWILRFGTYRQSQLPYPSAASARRSARRWAAKWLAPDVTLEESK